MSVITILFSRFCSIVYPTIGKPRFSVLAQFLHLIVLVPTIIISIQYGFRTLYIARSLVRFELILVNMVLTYILIKFSPWKMIKNLIPELIASTIMALVAYSLLLIGNSILYSFVCILICIICYFSCIMLFPKEKQLVMTIKDHIQQKIKTL